MTYVVFLCLMIIDGNFRLASIPEALRPYTRQVSTAVEQSGYTGHEIAMSLYVTLSTVNLASP